MTEFIQLIVSGVSTGASYALIGAGFVLIYQTTGVLNFAQGTFAVAAAMTMTSAQHVLWGGIAAVIAALVAAAAGGLMAPVALGFRRDINLVGSLIITIGIALLGSAIELLIWGENPQTYPGISNRAWNVHGVLILPQYALLTGVTIGVTLLLVSLLRGTIHGTALLACADQRGAAALIGINVRRAGIVSFALAGALGGIAGILLAPLQPLDYQSDVGLAVNGFAAAALGGIASIPLTLVGGLLLGGAESLIAGYYDARYQFPIALAVLIGVMIYRTRNEVEA